MHDQPFDGKRIPVLTMVDTLSRVSPAVDFWHSYRGSEVVETHECGVVEFGYTGINVLQMAQVQIVAARKRVRELDFVVLSQ